VKKYDIDEIEDLLNNLDTDEVVALAGIMEKLDRLEVVSETGDPKWTEAEMDLIGRFTDLSDHADEESDEGDTEASEESDASESESDASEPEVGAHL
jgi:hypothetical protein